MRCDVCAISWHGPRVRFCGRCGRLLAARTPPSPRSTVTLSVPAWWLGLAVALALAAVAATSASPWSWPVPDVELGLPTEATGTGVEPLEPARPADLPLAMLRLDCDAPATELPANLQRWFHEAGVLVRHDGGFCVATPLADGQVPGDGCVDVRQWVCVMP